MKLNRYEEIIKHSKLLDDLADAKGGIFKNCHLGSPWLTHMRDGEVKYNTVRFSHKGEDHEYTEVKKVGVPIADLITIKPSYNRFCLTIYEVKSSRSDFQSDIRSGKWEKYLPHCHRLYFAIERGVAKKEEIPEGVGLYVRGEKGWKCIKQADVRDIEIDKEVLLSMLFYRQKNKSKERDDTYIIGKSKKAEKKLKELGFDYNEYFRYIRGKERSEKNELN